MEEIKVGDKVRVREDAPRVYQKGSLFDYTEHQSTVHELDGDAAIIGLDIEDSPIYSAPIAIPTKYLIKVEVEAKEPKFKRGDKVVSKPPFVEKVWTVLGYDECFMPYDDLVSIMTEGTVCKDYKRHRV